MGAIAFSKKQEESWVVAGWAFHQILDDTLSQQGEDSEMIAAFEEAKALGGLMVYMLEPKFARRVSKEIERVTRGILEGNIRSGIYEKRYGGEKTVAEYRAGLRDLLKAIPATQPS